MKLKVLNNEMTIQLMNQREDYILEFRFDRNNQKADIYHVTEHYTDKTEKHISTVTQPFAVMQSYVDDGWQPMYILTK